MKFHTALLDYGKPFEIDETISFQSIRYDDAPLLLKNNNVYVPFEVSKYGNVALTIPKESDMFNIIKEMEKTLRMPIMKMPKDEKYSPTINVKVGSVKNIPVKSFISCEVQLTGIWKNDDENKKGVSLKLLKIGDAVKPKSLESFKSIL